ncbi:hypothetical protein QAD02_017499 [Eretmocerus hayati]|uniref:Uncharacterized protein n=1 Tax=Eretmocerus hayati TaxID=131215 RepID=A0ACC2PE26_9HYME|nr:hypothetical protein QAD02_017499 [Eretmocerus hayati]
MEKSFWDIANVINRTTGSQLSGSIYDEVEEYLHFIVPYLDRDNGGVATSLRANKRSAPKQTGEFQFPMATAAKVPKYDKSALPAVKQYSEMEVQLKTLSNRMQQACERIAGSEKPDETEDPYFTDIYDKFQEVPADQVDDVYLKILAELEKIED